MTARWLRIGWTDASTEHARGEGILNSLTDFMASDGMPTPNVLRAPAAPPAAESFVHDHLRVVRRYLRMHGASSHLADDLAQEVFVVALQKQALALPPAAATTFLRRTARFLLLRHWRSDRAAIALADAVDDLWTRQCADDGGEGLLTALRGCVDGLTERSKQAIGLCYGVGAETPAARDAAALALGLQQNGLKTLLQRARQALRECIERRRP